MKQNEAARMAANTQEMIDAQTGMISDQGGQNPPAIKHNFQNQGKSRGVSSAKGVPQSGSVSQQGSINQAQQNSNAKGGQ